MENTSNTHKTGNNANTAVADSGYPIHIYKWGTEKETYCGIDLNTKCISFVVSSQVRALNDDKSKICHKCASYHYR